MTRAVKELLKKKMHIITPQDIKALIKKSDDRITPNDIKTLSNGIISDDSTTRLFKSP